MCKGHLHRFGVSGDIAVLRIVNINNFGDGLFIDSVENQFISVGIDPFVLTKPFRGIKIERSDRGKVFRRDIKYVRYCIRDGYASKEAHVVVFPGLEFSQHCLDSLTGIRGFLFTCGQIVLVFAALHDGIGGLAGLALETLGDRFRMTGRHLCHHPVNNFGIHKRL